jgi:hypothetical protein
LFAIALSVCLLVLVSEGMALLRLWSVPGGFAILAAVGVLGASLPQPLRLPTRRRSAAAPEPAVKLPAKLSNGRARKRLEKPPHVPLHPTRGDENGADETGRHGDSQPPQEHAQ